MPVETRTRDLLPNATLGWWWADIAAGGVLVGYGLREGIHALRTLGSDTRSAAGNRSKLLPAERLRRRRTKCGDS